MKILYVSFEDINNPMSIGIQKKIVGQVKGLRKNNHSVLYTLFEDEKLMLINEYNEKRELKSFKNKLHKRINRYCDEILEIVKNENIDLVYIRYNISDIFFINFLKKLKKLKKKIYVEIPTYPYDKELNKITLYVDKKHRGKMKKYIDRIIISSNKCEKVFGINTIHIDNGVDVESIKEHNNTINIKENVTLIGVSLIRNCIGYDRVIKGMHEYYKSKFNNEREIKLIIVGDGPELENLKNMVLEYSLEKYISFEGVCRDNSLDSLFEKANIAIGSLADHRVGVASKSPLKSREYCARGIPFISSVNDPGFKESIEFILQVESNDEPLNIHEILEFYDRLKKENNINKMIRKYAMENFDWKKKYENFI